MDDSARLMAHKFVQAINRQDAEALAELMTDEHRFTDSLGNVVAGKEKIKAGWTGYFRMVPDYSIAVEETYCDGHVVVLLGSAQGTYAPDGDLKAENRWITPAAFRLYVEEGLAAEWRVYADNEPIRQLMQRRS